MRKLSLPDRAFGDLLKYILDDNITDINWSRELWINHLEKGRYKVSNFKLDDIFIKQFYTRISNLMNVQFNQNNPLLEAETENLRISILHDSVTNTGISISIRKTPAIRRINKDRLISEEYCTEEIDAFMENAIRAHCTVIVGGLPGVGKTEYIKYLTGYIPAYERVYTIEDNLELRYAAINPDKDCVEIKVSESQDSIEEYKAKINDIEGLNKSLLQDHSDEIVNLKQIIKQKEDEIKTCNENVQDMKESKNKSEKIVKGNLIEISS